MKVARTTTTPRLACGLALVGALCGLTLACGSRQPGLETWEFAGETMGTTYSVKVVPEGLAEGRKEGIAAAIRDSLDEVNTKMSHYREDSEVSRFNRWDGVGSFEVSPETVEVLVLARQISDATDGAFDVTVAPLVNAWGFGPDGRLESVPSVPQVRELLRTTGYDLLEIASDRRSLGKGNPDLTVDLSAIAKGYGVDRVAAALDARGASRYMVEVGGEIRTRGSNAFGEAWRIAIEKPDAQRGSVQLVVPLSDLAMATSGDYRNYYEIDGERMSHTIDPRSGVPIRHRVTSVSVVTEDCASADAYATALLVLGPDGIDLAERLDLAAFFLLKGEGEGFEPVMTSGFEALLPGE